jgi:hypothetical protein
MIENLSTAERLKTRLNEAFAHWQSLGTGRTQAYFAKQCAELSGRRCTPQGVSGWLKTGRMDKAWLPVAEKVLGQSLGFGLAPEPQAQEEVRIDLVQIGLKVMNLASASGDPLAKGLAEVVMICLMRTPQIYGDIAQKLDELISSPTSGNNQQQNGHRPPGQDFETSGDLGNGERDSDQEATRRGSGSSRAS